MNYLDKVVADWNEWLDHPEGEIIDFIKSKIREAVMEYDTDVDVVGLAADYDRTVKNGNAMEHRMAKLAEFGIEEDLE
jgi:hypothetical protein